MVVSIPDNNNNYFPDIPEENADVPQEAKAQQNVFAEKLVNEIISRLSGKRIQGLEIGNGVAYILDDTLSSDPKVAPIIEHKDIKEGDKIVAYRLYTNNIMGYVGVKKTKGKNQSLRIYSRFDHHDKDYFLHYMLQRSFFCNLYQDLYFTGDNMGALDLLQLVFPSYLKQAYQQGIFRKYRTFQHNDSHLKGNIDVQRHILHNIPFQGKIAYTTREFSRNNEVIQLIRHTIEFMSRHELGRSILRNDTDTLEAVNCVKQYTPDYSPGDRAAIIRKNQKSVYHPFYTKYRPLQELCLRILRYEKMSYNSKGKSEIYGILYDGALLWENYLASILSPTFTHYTNSNSYFLFRDERGNFQQIIPDYLGSNESGETIVADAKYIQMEDYRNIPADRAMPIYYKTLMYMLRFNAKKGFLFYPNRDYQKVDDISVKEFQIIDTKPECKLYLMGLNIPSYRNKEGEKKDMLYKDFCEQMKVSERAFIDYLQKEIND